MEPYVSKDILDMVSTEFNFSINQFELEVCNHEYEAFNFNINNNSFKSRLAKKTPKKAGYFVTLWLKNELEKNRPYNYDEMKDKLIINVLDGDNKGQFIFPKELLADKGVLRIGKEKGKMAFRIYPSWETNLNKAAIKTQKWQAPYFLDLSKEYNNTEAYELYLK